jgi:hypothetical protein
VSTTVLLATIPTHQVTALSSVWLVLFSALFALLNLTAPFAFPIIILTTITVSHLAQLAHTAKPSPIIILLLLFVSPASVSVFLAFHQPIVHNAKLAILSVQQSMAHLVSVHAMQANI